MSTQKKSGNKLVLVMAVLLAAAVLAYGAGPGDWFGVASGAAIEGAPVRRGPLRITVVESGNLKSKDSISLKSELEGQSTILYLIKEGAHVQVGELLCELDATKLVEQRVQQQITLRNAEAAWVKAKQAYDIQLSQNESDIAAAQRKSDFAAQDLQKYIDGDWPQKRKSGQEAILLAEEEVKRAQEKLEWSRKLSDKGFLTRTELEADQLAATSAGIKQDQARRALELLEKYDYPQQRKKFEADKEEADRGLDRTRLQAEARRVDAEAAMVTSKDKLGLEKERLAKLESQIEKAKIHAPVEGMVVYAQQEGGRWGGGDPIQEGTTVRERQEIITLPSATTKMVAEVSLHESVLEQVQAGQRVTMTVDALPGRSFAGLVDFKAVLPDKNAWWANPNLRLYRTQIELDEADPALRPGMSCSLEILVGELADATYVPVQCVFLDKGKTVAFKSVVTGWEKAPIKVGRHSAKWVEILEGLKEGDTVLLSQPPGSSLEAALQAAPAPLDPRQASQKPGRGAGGRDGGGASGANGANASPAARGPEAGGANPGGRAPGVGRDGAGRTPGREGGGRERAEDAGGGRGASDGGGAGLESARGTDGARDDRGAKGANETGGGGRP
jgi:HlyD family secretion protein